MTAPVAGKPVLISSYHWHEPWFSVCCGLDMDKYDVIYVDDSSADDFDIEGNVSEICAKLKAQEGPAAPILSCTDSMMIVHAMTKDALKDDPRFAAMPGASLCATVLCDHKYLTRKLVPGCGTVKCGIVKSEDAVIPAIEGLPEESDMILKPVAALGSVNVYKVKAGEPSPFHGMQAEKAGALHKATFLHVERFGATVPGASECIGILEEYIDPSIRKVSVDGAFVQGQVFPWLITDNVYWKDKPEVFEALESPSSRTTKEEQDTIWELFESIVHGLHRLTDGDFDRQFVCVEMFVFDASRVEVMEVNIRVSANQLPVFHKCLVGGCPLAGQVLMQGPEFKTLKCPTPSGKFGCTLYRPTVEEAGPLIVCEEEKDGFEAQYYKRNPMMAHVYGYGASAAAARDAAEKCYARAEQTVVKTA